MFEGKSENESRKQILDMIKCYYEEYHNVQKEFEPGDKISYSSRVYDSKEMVNLVDSALDFWLTSGKYTERFEKEFS